MKDLIEALIIFNRYNPKAATHCEHDELAVLGVAPSEVSNHDIKRLDELGFTIYDSEDGFDVDPEDDGRHFVSYRWGSA